MKTRSNFKYLDKGFVEVINIHGNDVDIALAARASYNDTEYGDDDRNAGLIDYLIRHRHTSPLEMPSITLRIKLPIFVMRQHVRHRTASLNEVSLRYITHDGDYWLPTEDEVRNQSKDNKQGSDGSVDPEIAKQFIEELDTISSKAWQSYNKFVDMGVANEECRAMLPVNFYTTCVWKMDLHNLFHYLKLRTDSHAQKEIRVLAEIIEAIVKESFPIAYNSWVNHSKESVTFSSDEMKVLSKLLQDNTTDFCIENSSLPKSRKRELKKKLGFI